MYRDLRESWVKWTFTPYFVCCQEDSALDSEMGWELGCARVGSLIFGPQVLSTPAPTTNQPTDGPDRPWDPERLGAVLCAPVGLCRQTFVSVGMHLSKRLNAKLPGGSIMPPGSDTPPPFAKPDSSLGPPGRIIFPPASYWLSIAPALLAIYHSGLHHPPFVSAPIVSLSPTEE